MKYLRVLISVFKYQIKLRIRYSLNFIMYLITMYIIFLALFTGISKNMSTQRLISTFFLWSFSVAGYTEITAGLISEIKEGTIIQLLRSPSGYLWVITSINISSFITIGIISLLLLFIIEITTQTFIVFNLISIIIILITVLSSYGIGIAIAGLSILYKEMRSFIQLINILLGIAISLSPQKHPLLKYIPISMGNHLITKTINDININTLDFLTLSIISFLYLIIGYFIFYCSMEKTRKEGTLSHY